MKIHSYIRNLLFFLLALYNAQGTLYPIGTFISQSILGLVLVISALYFFKLLLLKTEKPLFFKAWTLFFILNIFGFIFTGIRDNPVHLSMLKGIIISFILFYPFYYYSSKGLLTNKIIIQFFMVILPVTIFQFFTNEQNLMIEENRDDVVNNLAYAFVGLLPFAFLIRKKIVSYGVMIVLLYFIIGGAKRGAIVTGALGFILFMYYQMRTVDKKQRLKGYLISLIGIGVLSYVAISFLESNEFLMKRLESMQEGDSSGRDLIFANIFNAWYYDNSVIHFLFGYGFAGSITLNTSGHLAHNDWLELLSNFGLLGISVYLFVFYAGFSSIKDPTWNVNRKIIMFTTLSIWFIITFFSMGYNSESGYIKSILIAFLIGNKKINLN